MSEQQFQVGDVVQLKSGGPSMTYSGDNTYGMAICTWFEGKKKHQEVFAHATLKKYVEPTRAMGISVSRG